MGMKTIGRFTYDYKVLNESEVASLEAGSIIPLNAATVSTKALSNDNGLVTISAPGAYLIEANVTYYVDEASVVETRLLRNGAAIAGAHAEDDVATAASDVSQAFTTVITVGCGQSAIINLEAVKAADVCIANLVVVKLA